MWGKLLAGAGALALAAFLVWMFGSARFDAGELAERDRWKTRTIEAERALGELRVANERRQTEAAERYAARLASIEPIIIRSTDTVTRYAETPAGRALCLSPDRVLGIDADAAALFPPAPAPAGGSSATMRTNAAAETAGWVNVER